MQLFGGCLQIDGIEIYEPFTDGSQPRIDRTWTLRDDEYVVLGDNRRHSRDSRTFGPVPRRNIAGKVIVNVDQQSG